MLSSRRVSDREPSLSGILVEPLPTRGGESTASSSTTSINRQGRRKEHKPPGAAAWQQRVALEFRDLIRDPDMATQMQDQVVKYIEAHPQQTEDQYFGLLGQLRIFLSTGSPARNQKALQRLSIQKADEWARIGALQSKLAELKEQDKKRKALEAQVALRATLDKQKEEQERVKQQEDLERAEAQRNIDRDLNSFKHKQEQQRLQREQEIAARKAEVDRQLAERQWQKGVATHLKLQDEMAMAERAASECRQKMEADLRAQAEARDDYKRSVQANEQEQRRKAERKQKEQEENAAILQQAIALRVKQDQARENEVQRRRDIQARQAKEAAARPESKRWIDPNIIEGYVKKKEMEQAKEEASRKAAVVVKTQKLRVELARQVAEKEEKECQRLREQSQEWLRLQSQAQEDQLKSEQERRAAVDKANRFKAVLDKQVAEIKAKRNDPYNFMSAEERALNKKLLQQIAQLQLEGKL